MGRGTVISGCLKTYYAKPKYFSFPGAGKCVMWVIKGSASSKAMLPISMTYGGLFRLSTLSSSDYK
jgi:hypothetical protein